MSLNFSVRDVKNWKEVCLKEDGNFNATAESMVWLLMTIGVGRITEKNWREVFKRIYVEERATGARRSRGGEKIFFTAEEVQAFIGLHTNVSDLSEAEYLKRLGKSLMQDAQDALRRHDREQTTTANQEGETKNGRMSN